MDNARAEYLVRHYSDTILRIGYTWLGNIDDAEDICQMVLISLLKNGRSFTDSAEERAWVIRVTINACKDWKKSAWFRHRIISVQQTVKKTELHSICPAAEKKKTATAGQALFPCLNIIYDGGF